jgi:DNA-binding transcriptional regulator YdaS (Cro superfamily)
MDSGIALAVAAAGSKAKLAAALGISRGAICQWKRIPSGRLVAVEEATGVSRRRLRPDLYIPKISGNALWAPRSRRSPARGKSR